MSYHKVTAGDFMIYLVLTVVTLGIYPACVSGYSFGFISLWKVMSIHHSSHSS